MMARQQRARKSALLITAVLLLAVASWGLGEWKPFAYNWPDKWDTRLAPLAAFVEKQTGYTFEHPVRARFLNDKEFNKLVVNDEADLSTDDKQYYADLNALLRTLGLADGSFDSFSGLNDLSSGNTLAYYSPTDREMVIRSDATALKGGALSASLRAVVVHELAHALQDQEFGLARINRRHTTSEESVAMTAVLEGHANAAESQYVEENFDDKELEQYQEVTTTSTDPKVKSIPEVLSAQQSAPYVFGPTFIAALKQKGPQAITDVFLKKPPHSLAEIILPSKYFAEKTPTELEPPAVPRKNEYALGDQLNQLDIYFILVKALGAPKALQVSDMWGNGKYTAYRAKDKNGNGKFCVSMSVVGSTNTGTQKISEAFTTWAKNPIFIDAQVKVEDDHVAISVCDPGTKVKHSLPTTDDTSQIFWRSSDMAFIMRSEENTDAECVSTGLYTEFLVEEISTNEEVVTRYGELLDECSLR
jgi:hypothetical protein